MSKPHSFEEIAELEGISPDAARMVFNRAMQKLTKKVSRDYHKREAVAIRQLLHLDAIPDYKVSSPRRALKQAA